METPQPSDHAQYFSKYPWLKGGREYGRALFPYMDADPNTLFGNPSSEIQEHVAIACSIIKEGMIWKTAIPELMQCDQKNLVTYAILQVLLNIIGDEYVTSAVATLICNHSKRQLSTDLQNSSSSIVEMADLCDLIKNRDSITYEGLLLRLSDFCYREFVSSTKNPTKPFPRDSFHQIPFIRSILSRVNGDLGNIARFPSLYQTHLNPDQLPAVYPMRGPLLVLAGAGSGKTRVITYKVVWLIEQGVDPQTILLMTFTRNAAQEMIHRVEELLGRKPEGLIGGTFHSVAARVLREYHASVGYDSNFGIIDEKDQKKLLKKCIPHEQVTNPLYFDREEFHGGVISADKLGEGDDLDAEFYKQVESLAPSVKEYVRISSLSKFLSWPIDKVVDEHYPKIKSFKKLVTHVLEVYEKKKRKMNVMDFDDLLVNFVKFLQSQASLPFVQGIKHILVDEFQDVNAIQAEIVRVLFTRATSLTVVGDDDQTIYEFRGASIAHIINLPNDMPELEIVPLLMNYRNRPEILAVTNQSIRNNETTLSIFQGRPKTLLPIRPEGARPFLCEFESQLAEQSFICNEIEHLHNAGIPYGRIAILFRSVKSIVKKVINPLERMLAAKQIPYRIIGGKTLFEKKHVKYLVAFLSLFSNQKNQVAWETILEALDGMGDKAVSIVIEKLFAEKRSQAIQITSYFGQGKVTAPKKAIPPIERLITDPLLEAGISVEARNSLENLKRIFYKWVIDPVSNKMRDEVPAVASLREFAHSLSCFLLTLKKVTKPNKPGHIEIVRGDLIQMEELISNYFAITEFLTDISLLLNPLDKEDNERAGVAGKKEDKRLAISTVHQFKGLERRVIFLPMLVNGSFPTKHSLKKKIRLEEERRIFYVACTRAQDLLYLSYARETPFEKDPEVSLFIREIGQSNLFERIRDPNPHAQLFTTWSLRADPQN